MASEKEVAVDAVRQAAILCQQVQSDLVRTDSMEKADRSPVTVADFGSQALICKSIAAVFPKDTIVAEEDSHPLQNNTALLARVSDYAKRLAKVQSASMLCDWIDRGKGKVGQRFWTLDPIDGTKGFLRRDQYAIALALIVEGEVKLGVLGCPNLPQQMSVPQSKRGCLFVAVRGEGSYMLGLDGGTSKQIFVSEAPLRFAESLESAHGDLDAHREIAHQLGITEEPIRIDSQVKYGLVARGDASIYIRLPNPKTPDYRECIWDHAAGMIIVEEAGGKVTDAEGRSLDFLQGRRMVANRGIVASNGKLHHRLIEAISNR
jgi:3'(2'), 5'-bisphosphate nucleotidase